MAPSRKPIMDELFIAVDRYKTTKDRLPVQVNINSNQILDLVINYARMTADEKTEFAKIKILIDPKISGMVLW